MSSYTKFLASRPSTNRKGNFNFISTKMPDSKGFASEVPVPEPAKVLVDLVKFQTEKKESKAKQESANYGFNLTSKVNKVTSGAESRPDANTKLKFVPKRLVTFNKAQSRGSQGFDSQRELPYSASNIPSTPEIFVDETVQTPKGNALTKIYVTKSTNLFSKKLFVSSNKLGKEPATDATGLKPETSTSLNSRDFKIKVTDSNVNDEYGGGRKGSVRKDSIPFSSGVKPLAIRMLGLQGKKLKKESAEPRKAPLNQIDEIAIQKYVTARPAMSSTKDDSARPFRRSREGSSNNQKELELSTRVFNFLAEEKFELLVEYLRNLKSSEPNINWHGVINSQEQSTGRSLVHFALTYQRLDLLVYLIENRADFHIRDRKGVIPLMIAASENWPEATDLVIENTHDVNIQDRFGNTALHIAVAKSNTEFIEKLLACRNVNVRQTNNEGMKPLDLAEVHLVVQMQSIFRKYESLKGENPSLSNSSRVNKILAKDERKTPRESAKTPSCRIIAAVSSTSNQGNEKLRSPLNSKASRRPEVPPLPLIDVRVSPLAEDVLQSMTPKESGRSPSHAENITLIESNYIRNANGLATDETEQNTEAKSSDRVESRSPDFTKKDQIVYFNPHHALGKLSRPGNNNNKTEPRSMVFTHKPEIRTVFVKKKSEKLFPTKFSLGLKLREGHSQAPATSHTQKISPAKESKQSSNAQFNLNNQVEEICARIDIEIFDEKPPKDGTKTFIKNKSLPLEKEATANPLISMQVKKPSLNDFIIHSIIGKGSFGEVYLVQKKGTKRFYAMKTLPKKRIIKENLTRYALTERNVLSTISHPFIVKLRYAFQNSKTLFLIMDYLPGGDLGRYLQDEGQISENKARIYAAEIILAISELHKRDIIFRDLKPENVLLDKDGHAMLSDFGLSKENVMLENQERSFCGSVAYLAPEMLKKTGHGKAMDWYLVGVIIYEMVVGIPPFFAETKEELFNNIEHATVRFPSQISANLKDLLSKLFEKDPTKRIKEEAIKTHKWFKDINWDSALQKKLKPPKPFIKRAKMNQLGDIIPDVENETLGIENLKGWTFIEEIGDAEQRAKEKLSN